MSGKVKQEDDPEIQEMAEKIIEINRIKLQAPSNRFVPSGNKPTPKIIKTPKVFVPVNVNEDVFDIESRRGRFGWAMVGNQHIPFLTRSGEKYCSVRMIELKVIGKYLQCLNHGVIIDCTQIRSTFATPAECHLLNDINIRHWEKEFKFLFSRRDLLIRLSDAIAFNEFLDTCYGKLVNGRVKPQDRCGFIRINGSDVVPYVYYKMQKYVPIFYFEGENENLQINAEKLEGWDLAYLKFCCKVQGIRVELYRGESHDVLSLEKIKRYFPPDVVFEDYWPSKVINSQLLFKENSEIFREWTRHSVEAAPMQVLPSGSALHNNQFHNPQTPTLFLPSSTVGVPPPLQFIGISHPPYFS